MIHTPILGFHRVHGALIFKKSPTKPYLKSMCFAGDFYTIFRRLFVLPLI